MRTLTKRILFCFFIVFQSFNICHADITFVDGKWETTFDCAEWTGPGSNGDTICGDVFVAGVEEFDGTTGTTYSMESTVDSNNPLGDGNGIRQYVLGTGDAVLPPEKTGVSYIKFANTQTELWVRFYLRYDAGFSFLSTDKGGEKLIYFKDASGLTNNTFITGAFSRHQFVYGFRTGGNDSGDISWDDYFGSTSNGSWHWIEFHIKAETITNAENTAGTPWDGVVQMWCDGDIIFNDTNYNSHMFSDNVPIKYMQIHSNWHGLPLFPGDGVKYVDFDDIVIYNTTPPNKDSQGNPYIGPIILPGFQEDK